MARAGDVNGKLYEDVLVGAPNLANGQSDEGRAYLFVGSATGLGLAPAWTVEANLASATLGSAVASAGDVDGNGYDEILVGAPGYKIGSNAVGAAFAYSPLAVVDADLDGYPVGEDCNDGNAAVNPGHAEVPGNGLDDDCNVATSDCLDGDGDGYFAHGRPVRCGRLQRRQRCGEPGPRGSAWNKLDDGLRATRRRRIARMATVTATRPRAARAVPWTATTGTLR
ncbi:MAG: MopE-related protein [bacterium]